jgi:hypothetical protein
VSHIFDIPERIDQVEKPIREFRDNCHDGLANLLELGRGSFAARDDEAEVFWVGLAVLVVPDLLIKKVLKADFKIGKILWLSNVSRIMLKPS